jgi:hypothetical protein
MPVARTVSYYIYTPGKAQPITLAPTGIWFLSLNDLGDVVGYDNN